MILVRSSHEKSTLMSPSVLFVMKYPTSSVVSIMFLPLILIACKKGLMTHGLIGEVGELSTNGALKIITCVTVIRLCQPNVTRH